MWQCWPHACVAGVLSAKGQACVGGRTRSNYLCHQSCKALGDTAPINLSLHKPFLLPVPSACDTIVWEVWTAPWLTCSHQLMANWLCLAFLDATAPIALLSCIPSAYRLPGPCLGVHSTFRRALVP